ncbi:MAG: metal-dependent transcriptional regulator [Candidatus Poseidoniales archaeon]|jgi:DtxR family Mn-dependent transcriptional regulator|tara:strand:+ start:1788 stop:2447 length:660 start_codon:yes stop_codon:yes gene_type:complete
MGSGHFQEFEDEYMETLYEFWEVNPTAKVKTGEVAKALGVSPASATEMVQRLATKGFVDYELYKGLRLTQSGLEFGRRMKKKHRLAECFLIDILDFQGDAHETACMLEHALTDELEETLDVLLGKPTHNPDGKEIPRGNELDVNISLPESLVLLKHLEEGERASIFSILIQKNDNLLLEEFGIKTGISVERTPKGIIIEKNEYQLDDELMKRILVKYEH